MDCPSPEWTGILLAGGKSTRMGVDKRHLVLRCLNQSLMENAGQLLASLCAERLILVPTFSEPNLPVGFIPLPDRCPGEGPLQALSDCLLRINTAYALVIPVDMPNLRTDQLLPLMHSMMRSDFGGLARFVLDSTQRPTFPLFVKQEFATPLAAEMASGQVRLFQALRAAGAEETSPDWPLAPNRGSDALINLNHPADLKTLESGFPPAHS